jgi:hypothetical protein
MEDWCAQSAVDTAEAGQGWHLLSHADAASQWRARDQSLPSAGWEIRGNCLELVDPATADSLHLAGTYRNFDLRWDWEIEKAGNSGVKYLAHPVKVAEHLPMVIGATAAGLLVVGLLVLYFGRFRFPRAAKVLGVLLVCLSFFGFWQSRSVQKEIQNYRNIAAGFEYQMLDDTLNPEGAIATRRTGDLYGILAGENEARQAPGSEPRRHSSRILLVGQQAQHWLDGRLILEYSLDSPVFREALARSKFRGDSRFSSPTAGLIHLQNHQSRVIFRNIRIRELRTTASPSQP